MLNISGLSEGVVLDHIQAGKSMDIYRYLNLDRLECQIAIIKNARSSKMGRKDIIKIEGSLDNLETALPELDILYMTRVQRERFFNEEDYIRLKDSYILTKDKMKLAREDMFILHPLPRVNEISVEVDDDPRAAYFHQAQCGVYVRMALILTLLDIHVD